VQVASNTLGGSPRTDSFGRKPAASSDPQARRQQSESPKIFGGDCGGKGTGQVREREPTRRFRPYFRTEVDRDFLTKERRSGA